MVDSLIFNQKKSKSWSFHKMTIGTTLISFMDVSFWGVKYSDSENSLATEVRLFFPASTLDTEIVGKLKILPVLSLLGDSIPFFYFRPHFHQLLDHDTLHHNLNQPQKN
jgi:hypothetical protein